MQRPEIVGPVSELSEWVNALVIVEKPNGKLWIGVTPKYSANGRRTFLQND